MQTNRRVCCLAAVGRLLLSDCCGAGHGESEKVPGPYKIEDFAEDLHALTDALRLGCCGAGFSLGGLIARAFALSYPDRLRKLAL